jgi:hypothetical protein
MTTRIVVANQGRARFFDWLNRRSVCRMTGELKDPLARLHNRDFNSDRPGRVFERGRRRRDFDGIVLVAGPPFLGLLRRMVRAELPKDLVQGRIDPARRNILGAHARNTNGLSN